MTHRLLDARFLETACGLLTTPGTTLLRWTIAGPVDCPACIGATAQGPLFAPVPVTPHPGATP